MKKPLKKTQALFGLAFFVLVVIGAIIGSVLVKQQQDNRNQASGGEGNGPSENEVKVCIVVEADGKTLDTWTQVPPTKFSIKAGPVSSNFDDKKDKLPDKWEDQLDTLTIEAPRETNTTLDNGQKAVCESIKKRGPGYIYKRLEISSSGEWETPKYSAVSNGKDISLSDYSAELFDEDTSNNDKKNENADGLVKVNGGNNRKIIISLKLKSALAPPPSAPTAAPTQAPTTTTKPKATPTKAASSGISTQSQTTSAGRDTTLAENISSPTPTVTTTITTGSQSQSQTQSSSTTATSTLAPTTTPTRTLTPTRTPTHTLTPTRTPTTAPSGSSSSTNSNSTATQTQSAAQTVATATPASTTTGTSTSNTTTSTSNAAPPLPTNSLLADSGITPTTNPVTTIKPRSDTNLSTSDAPVSGGIFDTLALVGSGSGLVGWGIYFWNKNKTREKKESEV